MFICIKFHHTYRFPNASNLSITKVGDITQTFKNVVVSPDLSTSTIWIGQLVGNNYDVNFFCIGCLEKDKMSRKIIVKGTKVGQLFPTHY